MSICDVCLNLDWNLYSTRLLVRPPLSESDNESIQSQDDDPLFRDEMIEDNDGMETLDDETNQIEEDLNPPEDDMYQAQDDMSLSTNETNELERSPTQEKRVSTDSTSLALSASSGCELCSILHQGLVAFRQYTASLRDPWKPWDLGGPCKVDIELRRGRSLSLSLSKRDYGWEEEPGETSISQLHSEQQQSLGRDRYELCIEFFTCADSPTSPWTAFGIGKPVTENLNRTLSVQLIREWLHSCTEEHICIFEQFPKLPTRVLDLAPLADGHDLVLFESKTENASYMTLSHCWGESTMIETRKDTLREMKSGIPLSSLPQTFQDAIAITQDLGIRYLWIDSLCIIQDDIDDWEKESSRMAAVYANTYLNIAATCSRDSSDGIFQPRWHEAMVVRDVWSCPVKDVKITGTHQGQPYDVFARFEMWRAHRDFLMSNDVSDIHHRSPLLARSWVFQELYLSPRTIHFHSSELIWECKKSLRCECGELEHEVDEENALSRHRSLNSLSTLSDNQRSYLWLSIVTEYCQLNLTRESDRLPALAGLASRFENQSTGKYFAGLWQNDLVRMLLWSLSQSKATCERDFSIAPSWSWASIVEYNDPNARGDNSPNYVLVRGSPTSFKQDANVKILDVTCTVPGINPYGQVSDGTIIIQGSVIYATLVRRRVETHVGNNDVGTSISLHWDNSIGTGHSTRYFSEAQVLKDPAICVGVDVIFELEDNDLSVVTRESFIPDIWIGDRWEVLDGDEVLCLFLGTSKIDFRDGARTMALCLVLRYSEEREGAFERIGVMMCETDSVIFQEQEGCVIELI
ncbi:hypothetical protein GLAREA_02170 [Glarea lozoyensis ATCC 20868]|uniref:Heterokaryon incompatibility domain-containing protein n=1 Tax=Glarea lozoyensis (strain ATCC 20868 / MF5171) TaxID=1116229 RepID=S3DI69_GLAL2|nr:uncharacterized protein GLAREA_02170 [Glarea lozoyensis ATCC 20868]EPE26258.1 hypothetical protein GLAREA_02170 [Glarea lozoyensis ATCC 20868]